MPVNPLGSAQCLPWIHGCCLYCLCAPLSLRQGDLRDRFGAIQSSLNQLERGKTSGQNLMDPPKGAPIRSRDEHLLNAVRMVFEAASKLSVPLRHKRNASLPEPCDGSAGQVQQMGHKPPQTGLWDRVTEATGPFSGSKVPLEYCLQSSGLVDLLLR